MKLDDRKLDDMLKNDVNGKGGEVFDFDPKAKPRMSGTKVMCGVLAGAIIVSGAAFGLANLDIPSKDIAADDDPAFDETSKGDGEKSSAKEGKHDDREQSDADPSDDRHHSEDVQKLYPTEVAEWYAPGELNVITCAKFSLASNMQGTIPNAPVVSNVGARTVSVDGEIKNSEHSGHSGVYFDLSTGGLVCYECLSKKALESKNIKELGENEKIHIDFAINETKVLFAITDGDKITKRFILDTVSNGLTPIPVLSENDFEMIKASKDGRYIVTHSTTSDEDAVYLIDTTDGSHKKICVDYNTFMLSYFSKDGNYVMNMLQNVGGATYSRDNEKAIFAVYNIKSGVITEGVGQTLAIRDNLLITRDESSFHVYDMDKGEEIAPAEDLYILAQSNGQFYRINLFDTTVEKVWSSPLAFTISEDGKYAYIADIENIFCMDAESGEVFRIEFEEKLVIFTNIMPHFSVFVSDDGKEISVYYYYSEIEHHEQSEGEIQLREISDLYSYALGKIKDDFTNYKSIEDAYTGISLIVAGYPESARPFDIFEKAFPGGFSWYGNDDYTVLSVGDRLSFVESYTGKYFTALWHSADFTSVIPFGKDMSLQKLYIVDLKQSLADTQKFLNTMLVDKSDHSFAFTKYISSGKLDASALEEYKFSDEYIDSISYYTVFVHENGGMGYDCSDKAALKDFMHKFRNSKQKVKYGGDPHSVCYIKIDGKMNICAEFKDSTCYIVVGETRYKVSADVFNAFVSLCENRYAESHGSDDGFSVYDTAEEYGEECKFNLGYFSFGMFAYKLKDFCTFDMKCDSRYEPMIKEFIGGVLMAGNSFEELENAEEGIYVYISSKSETTEFKLMPVTSGGYIYDFEIVGYVKW